MNPLGLAARIVAAAALFVAFVLTFVPRFLVVSIDMEGLEVTSAGTSAWQGTGVLGCMATAGGLVLAIASTVLPTQLSLGRRLLAGLASAACLLAVGLFVLFLLIKAMDIPDGIDGVGLGFGWSGFVVLGLLTVGMLAGLAGAMVADRAAAPVAQTPPPRA